MGVLKNYKAAIFGIAGQSLSPEEKDFFQQEKPVGFILFSRNIANKQQVQKLVHDLRKTIDNPNAPILIDQEGGRVARLRAPTWYSPSPAAIFGKIAGYNLDDAKRACALNTKLIAKDLLELGINVDCAPVADVPVKGAHDVIGDRAFSYDKEIVTQLARVTIDSFVKQNITPIIKHIPGHGRATADSHLKLPIVDADYKTLQKTDFYPFKNINNVKWAMTAHIIYNTIDPKNPATQSSRVINEIRSTIGFEGLIVTDAITMQALSGSMGERADKSFKAGCDLAIHSNGNLNEMLDVIKYTPILTNSQIKLLNSSCSIGDSSRLEDSDIKAELNHILKKYNSNENNRANLQDPTENIIY
jgi:beta-N-acetylhexosaminidase